MNAPLDPFDALASIFIRSEEHGAGSSASIADAGTAPVEVEAAASLPPMTDRPNGSRAVGAVRLEAVVPGHLPVRGSIWLAPFVRAVAGSRPIALVRCDPDAAAVELHGIERPGDRASQDAEPVRTVEALAAEVGSLRSRVRDWLVRPASGAPPESVIEAQPDRVTVLSSGDQVSAASCWEIFRRVIERCDELGHPRPALAVAVVGCEMVEAETLVGQLDRTSQSRLDASVELRCCIPRIESGAAPDRVVDARVGASPAAIATWLGREQDSVTDPPPAAPVADSIKAVDRASTSIDPLDAPAPAPAPTSAPAPAPVPAPAPEPHQTAGRRDDADRLRPVFTDLHAIGDDPVDTRPRPTPVPATPATPEPTGVPSLRFPGSSLPPNVEHLSTESAPAAAGSPASPPAPDGPAAARRAGLGAPVGRVVLTAGSGHLPPLASVLPGLHPLGPRCPGRETIELAVDGGGALHVLGPIESVADLPLVAHWAITHAELLGLACPEHRFDPATRPRGHVFTSDPASVAGLHATELHLHLLVPLDDARPGAWFSVPLQGARTR